MTVSVETNKSQLLVYASGTDQYSWGTFDVPTDADVRVYVFDDSGNGDATLLTLTTHYTVDTVNKRIELTATGHSFIAGLSYTNERIAIYRSIDSLTQSSEYTNQGAFLSQSIEDSFDQVYYILQEHSEILKRTIQIDPFDTVIDGYATEEEQRQAVVLPSLDGVTDGIVYFDSTLKQFAISDNVSFTNLSTVATNISDVNTVAADLSGSDTIGTVAADLAGSDTIGDASALVLAGSPGLPFVRGAGDVILATFGTGLSLNTTTGELTIDAELQDISGIAANDGVFIVGNGSDFVGESGNTALTSMDSNLGAFRAAGFALPTSLPVGVRYMQAAADGTISLVASGGGGDLIAANNLADVESVATARTNLDVAGRSADEYISGVWQGGNAVSRAEIKALDISSTADDTLVFLIDGGRSGPFKWDSSDLSTEVSADTREGIYIPPNSDATGASGAWVRAVEFGSKVVVNAAWWGTVAYSSESAAVAGTDSAPALQAAVTYLSSILSSGQRGGEIWIGRGRYRIDSEVDIGATDITIRGAGMNATALVGTHLYDAVLRWRRDNPRCLDLAISAGGDRRPIAVTASDAGADTLTMVGHPFSTEDAVRATAAEVGLSTSALYYIRKIDADTVSLHPSAADATANTNTVNITAGPALSALTIKLDPNGNSSPGIWLEPEDAVDSTALRIRWTELRNVRVKLQPSHGVASNGALAGIIDNCDIASNEGHGLAIAQDVYDRTNSGPQPGLIEIRCGNITGNGGHGVCTGPLAPPDATVTSPAVRVGLTNVEINTNASDSNVRLSNDQVYLRGAELSLERCVIKGGDTTGAILVSGRNIFLRNNRYGECTSPIITVTSHDLNTECVDIDGVNIFDSTVSYNPAVLVRTDGSEEPRRIRVSNVVGGTVTNLVATDATMGDQGPMRVPGLGGSVAPLVLYSRADQTINNTASYTTVPGLSVWLYANERVYLEAQVEFSGDASADIAVRFEAPTGATVRSGLPASAKVGASDTFDAQSTIDNAGNVVLGAAASRRLVTLMGYVQNGATAGYASLRFRQLVATVADTTVHAGFSHLKVYREPMPGTKS